MSGASIHMSEPDCSLFETNQSNQTLNELNRNPDRTITIQATHNYARTTGLGVY